MPTKTGYLESDKVIVKEGDTYIKIVDLNKIKGYFDGDSEQHQTKNKSYFLGE